jgi:hypothetical protein
LKPFQESGEDGWKRTWRGEFKYDIFDTF